MQKSVAPSPEEIPVDDVGLCTFNQDGVYPPPQAQHASHGFGDHEGTTSDQSSEHREGSLSYSEQGRQLPPPPNGGDQDSQSTQELGHEPVSVLVPPLPDVEPDPLVLVPPDVELPPLLPALPTVRTPQSAQSVP